MPALTPTFRQQFEYWLVSGVGWFLGHLPYRLAQRLGAACGAAVGLVSRKYLKRAQQNIRECLRVDDKEALRIARRMYRHLGAAFAEVFQMLHMSREQFEQHVDAGNAEELRRHWQRGKGVVVPSGHIGNWEYSGQMCVLSGMPPAVIVRALRNPLLNGLLEKARGKWGLKACEKTRRGLINIIRAVREGALTPIMCDLHDNNGIPTTFFGRPCRSLDIAARIALKAAAPVVPATSYRAADGRHVLWVHPEIPWPKYSSDEEAVRQVTQAINDTLERAIRAHPEQWLWTHRRFRVESAAAPPPDASVAHAARPADSDKPAGTPGNLDGRASERKGETG